MSKKPQPQTVKYTNWKGDTRVRQIFPIEVWWGSTEWHPEPQWLLKAVDWEDGNIKDFAMKDCDFATGCS